LLQELAQQQTGWRHFRRKALKFGATGLQLRPAIYHLTDLDVLRALYKGVKVAQSLAELRELYAALTAEAQA
jgi:hypothetical protein